MLEPRLIKRVLAFYLPSLPSGGIERIYLNLTPYFLKAGFSVTFVLDHADGTLMESIPDGVEIYEIGSSRLHVTLPALVRYLKIKKPDIFLTAHRHKNIIGIWAWLIARTKTRHILSIHGPVEAAWHVDRTIGSLIMPCMYKIFFRFSDYAVAVSKGLADRMTREYGSKKIKIIPNGVVGENFGILSSGICEHPWLREGRSFPTFIAAGRLCPEKDFSALIKAFAELLKIRQAKLIIFGEGALREKLYSLALEYKVSEHIDMPGFISNIFPAMKCASAFVVSSEFEGFGMVVAEALACGTPVVSTDCPYGPSEILESGKYGELVPVGDWHKLSQAMLRVLERHWSRDDLRMRGQSYSISGCAEKYLSVFKEMLE